MLTEVSHDGVRERIMREVGRFVAERRLGRLTDDDGITLRGTRHGDDAAPDMAIEVTALDKAYRVYFTKVLGHLCAGVRLIWVVVPEDRSVGVFRGPADRTLLGEADTLDGGDVLPGFSCRVADLFPG